MDQQRGSVASLLGIALMLTAVAGRLASAEDSPSRPLKRIQPVAAKKEPPKRARPPKWPADVLDAFFTDAREKLVGTRPNFEKAEPVVASSASPTESSRAVAGEVAPGASWSKLIDAGTIETEIKRVGKAVAVDVKTPTEFKGEAYKLCRQHFSVLAVLFGVTGEYDGPVRWQDAAPGLRDLFARAGRNCKVGTDQTFREADERKQNLEELIRGTRPQVEGGEKVADWTNVADRPPLMQRLNIAQQDRLIRWLADEREFKRHADDVKHEAQLIAIIADVIGRPGYEFADDEGYAGYARELRDAATEVSSAVDRGNFEQAKKAMDRATKACADCHEGYRG